MQKDTQTIEDLLADLQHNSPQKRRKAAFKLGAMHNPLIVPELIQAADDSDNTVRAFIASALAGMGSSSVDALQSARTHPSPHVRQVVVSALRHMNTSSLVEDIIPMLRDAHPDVRAAAADALRHYNTPQAQAALATQEQDSE